MLHQSYPRILPTPAHPLAMPCFTLSDNDSAAPPSKPRARPIWDIRCTRILERACRDDDRRPNEDVARLIEAETGMRFGEIALSRHRAALGYGRSRANDWTSTLRQWRPWQGHRAGES
jgi:hypothetical protein